MKTWLIAITVLCNVFISAQVEVKSYVNNEQTQVGEYIQYTVEANERGKFILPEFKEFKVVRGGGISSNSSINYVNGKMTRTSSYSTSYILQPLKKGEFIIPAATLEVNGTQYQSNTVKIIVGEGNANTTDASDLFGRIELNKSSCYVGEAIVATYMVYSKSRPDGYDMANLNTNQDFWTEELSTEPKLATKMIDGVTYYSLELKQLVLLPQNSGKLTIKPFDANIRTTVRKNFYGFSVPESVVKSVTSNATTINVKPLPKEASSGFVGNFSIYAELSKTETTTDEGFDLKLKIEGTGNLNRINELNMAFPESFDVYDPEISDKAKITSNGFSGSKTFQYFIIPRQAGEFIIEPFTLTYFDPQTQTVKTSVTPAFTIKVNQGAQNETATTSANKNSSSDTVEDVELKSLLQKGKKAASLLKQWWFWLLLSSPLLLWLLFKLLPKANHWWLQRTQQKKNVKYFLQQAEIHLKNNQSKEVYAHLLTAWQKGLNIPLAEFNKPRILKELTVRQVNTSKINEVMAIIQAIEEAGYAPVAITPPAELFSKTKHWLEELKAI
jgi:hypothetical protein